MTAVEASMRAVIDEATPRASAMVRGEEQGCTQAGQKVLVLVLVLLSAHAAHALPRSESKSQPDSHYATWGRPGVAWPPSLALRCGNRRNRCQSLIIARPPEP